MKNSFSFLAKHISWKYIVLILILIYIILLTVPYLPHKTVSEEYKEKDAAAEYYSDTSGTERIAYITDNNDALLYRLGMIEEAEKSIILSTFDFNDDEAGYSFRLTKRRGPGRRYPCYRRWNQRIYGCTAQSVVSCFRRS